MLSIQNQSGILFPIDGEVSELEAELIGLIKTTGKEKNYELVEYVNDVNREYTEVLMELNINGIMDTAYSYGDQRLTNERFTGWTGYYTYDPRGSVTGVTNDKGMIWQSYRYNANGELTFGKPQYNNIYSYNAESYNPNIQAQYLRARYYSPETANFLTEDSYLGNITDPLTLNRYNYGKSSPSNYTDPSGHSVDREEIIRYGYEYYWNRVVEAGKEYWNIHVVEPYEDFLNQSNEIYEDYIEGVIEVDVYSGSGAAVVLNTNNMNVEVGVKFYREIGFDQLYPEKMEMEIKISDASGLKLDMLYDIITKEKTVEGFWGYDSVDLKMDDEDFVLSFGSGLYLPTGGGEFEVRINVNELLKRIREAFKNSEAELCK